MYELRKKRILALAIGTGLIVIPLVLLWEDTVWENTAFFLQYWLLIPLILALIPTTVGGIVGAWRRGGSDHPWLSTSGFGVLIWWTLLLLAFIAFIVWLGWTNTPSPSGPEVGTSGPQPGYGTGIFLAFVMIYGGAYAVVGLPFILLGTALTYPRRGVAY